MKLGYLLLISLLFVKFYLLINLCRQCCLASCGNKMTPLPYRFPCNECIFYLEFDFIFSRINACIIVGCITSLGCGHILYPTEMLNIRGLKLEKLIKSSNFCKLTSKCSKWTLEMVRMYILLLNSLRKGSSTKKLFESNVKSKYLWINIRKIEKITE